VAAEALAAAMSSATMEAAIAVRGRGTGQG
jgi:hypothetical protein